MNLEVTLALLATSWLVWLLHLLAQLMSQVRLRVITRVLRVLAFLFFVPSLAADLLVLSDMFERDMAWLALIFGIMTGLPLGLYSYALYRLAKKWRS